MNCKLCQQHLLLAEKIDSLPGDVGTHLAACPSCRRWQKRLVQIENNVPLIPLPGSHGREAFVQSFTSNAPLPLVMLPQVRRAWPRRRVFAFSSGGLAAAAVLVACGIWLGNALTPPSDSGSPLPLTQKEEKAKDRSFAGKLLEIDLKLARSDSPRVRVEALARLADTLHGESRTLANVASPRELQALAKLYRKVVQEGIVARARSIPAGERRETLDQIAEQLGRARRETEALAKNAAPDSATPLLLIASAAGAGDHELRGLIKEATP